MLDLCSVPASAHDLEEIQAFVHVVHLIMFLSPFHYPDSDLESKWHFLGKQMYRTQHQHSLGCGDKL